MGSAREDAAATTAAPPRAVARSWSSCKETQRRLGEKLGAETRREPQQKTGREARCTTAPRAAVSLAREAGRISAAVSVAGRS
jgi:hypothetical protein